MKLTLSENIRTFRKQRKMTQEKLAEVLGVTVGAVYKWEAGLSLPELNLIVEMADFFDTSVDVLLGYRMKDNRLNSTLERLAVYCQTLNPAALAEAEKALGKYPHSFPIVHTCAKVYLVFGTANHDKEQLTRALELLEQANVLLSQNQDPRISETTICGDMSTAWFLLDEQDKGLELLKKNNAGGVFSSQIGDFLAVYMNRPEEASPYLEEALLNGVWDLLTTVVGYVFVFRSRSDWDSGLAIATWGAKLLTGLKTDAKAGILDKTHAEMLVLLAYVQKKAGLKEEAYDSLQKAGTLARRFDSTPDYSLKTMRFVEHMEQAAAFDLFGATARGSIGNLIGLLEDPELSDQWKEMIGHEQ